MENSLVIDKSILVLSFWKERNPEHLSWPGKIGNLGERLSI